MSGELVSVEPVKTTNERAGFMDLPYELRDQIYDLAVSSTRRQRNKPKISNKILSLNRDIHDEFLLKMCQTYHFVQIVTNMPKDFIAFFRKQTIGIKYPFQQIYQEDFQNYALRFTINDRGQAENNHYFVLAANGGSAFKRFVEEFNKGFVERMSLSVRENLEIEINVSAPFAYSDRNQVCRQKLLDLIRENWRGFHYFSVTGFIDPSFKDELEFDVRSDECADTREIIAAAEEALKLSSAFTEQDSGLVVSLWNVGNAFCEQTVQTDQYAESVAEPESSLQSRIEFFHGEPCNELSQLLLVRVEEMKSVPTMQRDPVRGNPIHIPACGQESIIPQRLGHRVWSRGLKPQGVVKKYQIPRPLKAAFQILRKDERGVEEWFLLDGTSTNGSPSVPFEWQRELAKSFRGGLRLLIEKNSRYGEGAKLTLKVLGENGGRKA